RNGSVSVASTLVMTVTLSVIAALLFVGALLQSTLEGIRNQVDINVYFEASVTEEQALALQSKLESREEIASVSYTSPEQALENFRLRHEGNQLIMDALDEVGTNPLEASLNIRAEDPSY